MVVVEILSQDEPGLTAQNQEGGHQKNKINWKELWELEGRELFSGGDNRSSSPRYVRLQKTAAAVTVQICGYETKEESSRHWDGHAGLGPKRLAWFWPGDFPLIKTASPVNLLLRSGSVQHYWNEIFYFVHHLAHKFIR